HQRRLVRRRHRARLHLDERDAQSRLGELPRGLAARHAGADHGDVRAHSLITRAVGIGAPATTPSSMPHAPAPIASSCDASTAALPSAATSMPPTPPIVLIHAVSGSRNSVRRVWNSNETERAFARTWLICTSIAAGKIALTACHGTTRPPPNHRP